MKCASCTTGTAQLHWVDSAALDHHAGDMGVQGWEDYFVTLNGNLSTFNAFMHNANQVVWWSRGPVVVRRGACDAVEWRNARWTFVLARGGGGDSVSGMPRVSRAACVQ